MQGLFLWLIKISLTKGVPLTESQRGGIIFIIKQSFNQPSPPVS